MHGTPGTSNKRNFTTFSEEEGQVEEQPSSQRLRLNSSTSEGADAMEVMSAPSLPVTSSTQPNITSIVPAATNPATQLSPIERFPAELLQRIASHLDLASLGRCRQLSRHFAQALEQPLPLAAHLSGKMVRVSAEDDYTQSSALVLKLGGHFSKLKIELSPGSAEVGTVLSKCHAWQALEITVCDGALPELAPLLSKLHAGLVQAGVPAMRKLRLDLQHDHDAAYCNEDFVAESYAESATPALTKVLKELSTSPGSVLGVVELDIANLPLTSLLEQDVTPHLVSLGLGLREREFSQELVALLRRRLGGLQKFAIRQPPQDIGPLFEALKATCPEEIHLDSNDTSHACELIRLGVSRLNWTSSEYSQPGLDLGDVIGQSSSLHTLKIGKECNCGSGEALILGLASNASLREFEFHGDFSEHFTLHAVLIAKLICAAVRHKTLEKVTISIPDELKTECQHLMTCKSGLNFKFSFACGDKAAKDILAALYFEISGQQIGGIDSLPEIEGGFGINPSSQLEMEAQVRRIFQGQERRDLRMQALVAAANSSRNAGSTEQHPDDGDNAFG